eukprot:scaffold26402_cov81-Skeletonema_marinoi.AAC.2
MKNGGPLGWGEIDPALTQMHLSRGLRILTMNRVEDQMYSHITARAGTLLMLTYERLTYVEFY